MSIVRFFASDSYFAINASFSASSSLRDLSCASSCVLCDIVLSVSTRMRASSFCIVAEAISISSRRECSFSVAFAVFAAPFSTAICSPRLESAESRSFFVSEVVFCTCASRVFTSVSSAASCDTTLASSASVCSRERLSIASFSWKRSSFSLAATMLASTPRDSASSFDSVAVKISFLSSSFLMAFFTPITVGTRGGE